MQSTRGLFHMPNSASQVGGNVILGEFALLLQYRCNVKTMAPRRSKDITMIWIFLIHILHSFWSVSVIEPHGSHFRYMILISSIS